jgi:hypothetical protein
MINLGYFLLSYFFYGYNRVYIVNIPEAYKNKNKRQIKIILIIM